MSARCRGVFALVVVLGATLLAAAPAGADRVDGVTLSPGSKVCVGPVPITTVGTVVNATAERPVRWTVRTYDELGDPPTEVVRRDARYLIRPFRPSDTPGTLLEACAENIGTVRTAYFLTAVPQRTLTAQHVEASGSATPGTEACLWGDSGTSALRGTASAPVSWQVRHSDPADDSIETVRTVTATVLDETETPPPGLHVVVCMVNTGSGRATFEMDVIPS